MISFNSQYRELCQRLLQATPIHTGSVHSMDTSRSKAHATYELVDVVLSYVVPSNISALQQMIPMNLPWAEKHFQERVGGKPVNPPPSHVEWPWARHQARFQDQEVGPFSHSYPERMWPKFARHPLHHLHGIRFDYGDLNDLVSLLVREPLTRQAYLPIWFPEDTGTHHGERVPCTLGYHFMIRQNLLSCRYYMRSCDAIRHFPDDVYMAARLMQWVANEVNERWEGVNEDAEYIHPDCLRMYISSLHAFVGDKWKLEQLAK